ncbi:hypothetical protein BDV27DRAFT_119969 [Aspergillus caelatus]|uniref:Uncharacterized protein n=1 Tax=Aspergillus caelatus TaxID=61420 RepID=A0A5N7AJJ7_9EURO|nr:uncharacterized protein BDV27DRAFT_119969 [Aspergillus caelatus]KAE8370062.1 hypothetical protein BDV27DRAFT_119969 [Aspergillus caelatus]
MRSRKENGVDDKRDNREILFPFVFFSFFFLCPGWNLFLSYYSFLVSPLPRKFLFLKTFF